jgi:tetratricopeptide (TPR) repeat protein
MHCFREALRVDPAHAAARNNLGYALEVQGRLDEALAEFLEVRRREPDNAMAIASLSGLAVSGHHQLSEMELRRIEALAARSDLPPDDLCRLHFALSRLYDKAGAWDEAFAHCQRGNELRKEIVQRRGLAFDPTEHGRLVDRLIATFTPAYFARVASFGVESDLPVFIVGMMRSGTTLAEQILASHPRVHGAGELQDIPALVGGLHARSGAGREYPESMTDLNPATARALAEAQLGRLRQRGGPAERVVDKMPLNFLNLGVIATLFPRATIVHCRRDPVDTCASCYFQNFADPLPFKCDLSHLGLYYREYERLMAHWANVLPMRMFELRYEELTADPETVSRQLVAACGLAWDDRCLEFNVTERPVRTASMLQVRKPMYRSSVGRWHRYEKHLQPLREALGRPRP